MASKPTRNNGSSPTNLSPSRPIRNSCSTSAAGRSTHGSNVIGGGSKKGTISNTSSSSPIGQGRPGLTPKTQRKELAPLQNSNLTPQGSPKINNNTTTGTGSTTTKQQKTSSSTSTSVVSRKNSSKNNNINKRSSSTGGGGGPSARPSLSKFDAPSAGPSSTQNNTTPTIKLREETKFDGLWEVKTIDNGLIRLPTQCLDNLISKEGIEKYYEVEPKPVAR